MNAPAFPPADLVIPAEFQTCFDAEREANLKTLARLVKENRTAIVAAINADYGNRSEFETKFAEVFPVLDGIHDATKRLRAGCARAGAASTR